MDKQIIIDGVDVSECKHYCAQLETKMPYGEYEIEQDKCYYSGIEIITDCKGDKGCIYKQLKRKEQECEVLKRELNHRADTESDITSLCDKLELQNGQLKAEKDRILKLAKENADANEYCLQELEKENAELKAENKKLKDLLTDRKRECERLKKQYNCYACDTCSGKEDYINMKRHCENAIKSVHKYRTALEDIKQIAGPEYVKPLSDKDCIECDRKFNEILAKINEVIGAE